MNCKNENKKETISIDNLTKEQDLFLRGSEVQEKQRRDQLVRAIYCEKNLNENISRLLNTCLVENNIVYTCFSEDAYLSALCIADHLRNMLQIGDRISDESPRYGTLVSSLSKPVKVQMVRGMIKVDIPMLPPKSPKKKNELEAIERAVNLGIEEFRKCDPENAKIADKFRDSEYAIVEQYIIPSDEMIDIDRIDCSKIIDIISINFCSGIDDSRKFRTQVRTIKNFGCHRYACIYLAEKSQLFNQLKWIEMDY